MARSLIINGMLHSPCFIFLKCGNQCSDREVLSFFGLSSYQRSALPVDFGDYAVLSDDGTWKLIADDWYYTLWSMPSTRQVIRSLASRFDVYACSVGEADLSFDFVYYRDSRLVRHYSIEYPNYRDGIVVANEGEPLPAEDRAFDKSDPFQTVMRIADAIGIDLDFEKYGLRVYASPEPHRSTLDPYAAPISNLFKAQ